MLSKIIEKVKRVTTVGKLCVLQVVVAVDKELDDLRLAASVAVDKVDRKVDAHQDREHQNMQEELHF